MKPLFVGSISQQSSKVELITPETASEMLENNCNNRALLKNVVVKYAASMDRGEYRLNGQPIIISDKGRLLDGQHRLQAIILSGKPISMFVTRGIDESTFDTIDTGKSRSPADVLTSMGYSKHWSSSIVSAARYLILFNPQTGRIITGAQVAKMTSNHILVEYVLGNDDLIDAAAHMIDISPRARCIQMGWAIFLLYKMAEQNKDLAYEYMEQVMTGLNLNENDPAYAVRSKLERDRNSMRKLPLFVRACVLARGWYYVVNGKNMPIHDPNRWHNLNRAMFVFINNTTGNQG